MISRSMNVVTSSHSQRILACPRFDASAFLLAQATEPLAPSRCTTPTMLRPIIAVIQPSFTEGQRVGGGGRTKADGERRKGGEKGGITPLNCSSCCESRPTSVCETVEHPEGCPPLFPLPSSTLPLFPSLRSKTRTDSALDPFPVLLLLGKYAHLPLFCS